jgi:serine/threonine-protein kinase
MCFGSKKGGRMNENLGLAEPALALRLEQARRWRNDDRAPAEEYLARHPELNAHSEYALEVVYGEVLLREEDGETPQVEEYLERFPQFTSQIHRLFDVHRAVRSACLADSPAPDLHHQDTHPEFGGAAAPLPAIFLGYEMREELGRGGMGVVLVCRDNPLSRDLAVKVLRPEHRGNPAAEQRFLEEAQITGQLQHPGVVPVHQVGRLPDGRPYFTMKLVRGQTLACLLATRANPTQERPRFLAVFQQVCQTLAYAHSRRVVHRDLKPSNVMVGAFDEVQVMDWGLAKVLARGDAGPAPVEADVVRTVRTEAPVWASQTGAVLGTPAYMAPEQARGAVEQVDERSDVFGLGAMLCEILTGQPPYGGVTVEDVYRQARQGDLGAARARLQSCGAEAELIQLAERCLAADPGERPRDAGEVARAVTAYQTSVQERLRQAEVERAAAQAKARAERRARRWTLATAAAVLAVVLLGGGAWLWWQQKAAAATAGVQLLLEQLDPLMAEEKWPEALAVTRQANALLATGGVPAELQQRVREQLADAEMVVRLEEGLIHLKRKKGHYEPRAGAVVTAKAFREYDLNVEELEPAEAAERIRRRSIRDYLVVALEEWARQLGVADPLSGRLLAIAEQAVPEDRRAELHAARTLENGPALQKLANSIDVGQRSPMALLQLSIALDKQDNPAVAVSLLRRAQQRYPSDFQINYQLVKCLQREKPPPWHELLRLQTAGLALRSQNCAMYSTLGGFFEETGRLDEAIAAYRESIRLEPEHDPAYVLLADALDKKGELDQAIAACEEVLRLRPDMAYYHGKLGVLLHRRGLLDKAKASYQEALRLDPNYAEAHTNLGNLLLRQGHPDEALAAVREALRLKPDLAFAHAVVGQVLMRKGQLDDAIVAIKEALRLDPNCGLAHFGLGSALDHKDCLDEAIVAFRRGIRVLPNYAACYVGLGVTLRKKGQLDEAVAAYREGLRLTPDDGYCHLLLASALQDKGQFMESLTEARRGHALVSKDKSVSQEIAQHVHALERLVELDSKLPAILRGATKPRDAAERLELAKLCYYKNLPGTAAGFFAEAFAAQPALAEILRASNRYNAACMAALAGCGQGQDVPTLDPQTRARWRRQALTWLRADLALWTRQLTLGKLEARAEVRQTLEHWLRDSDLAGLREETALGKLPEGERSACRQLWAEVQRLLGQARSKQ